jgi:hypothetical protein
VEQGNLPLRIEAVEMLVHAGMTVPEPGERQPIRIALDAEHHILPQQRQHRPTVVDPVGAVDFIDQRRRTRLIHRLLLLLATEPASMQRHRGCSLRRDIGRPEPAFP